jgi:hypothetical protein
MERLCCKRGAFTTQPLFYEAGEARDSKKYPLRLSSYISGELRNLGLDMLEPALGQVYPGSTDRYSRPRMA